jgi:hypothetical protein
VCPQISQFRADGRFYSAIICVIGGKSEDKVCEVHNSTKFSLPFLRVAFINGASLLGAKLFRQEMRFEMGFKKAGMLKSGRKSCRSA